MIKTSIPKLHSIKWKNGAAAQNVVPIAVTQDTVLPKDRVFGAAYTANLSEVVIVGRDDDGELYVASTHGVPKSLLLVSEAQAKFSWGWFK